MSEVGPYDLFFYRVVQKIREEAEGLPVALWRGRTFIALAKITGEDSDFEAARQEAHRAMGGEVLIAIAQTTHSPEDIAAVRHLAKEWSDPYLRGKIWLSIAEITKELNDLKEAYQAAEEIPSWPGKRSERLELFSSLVRAMQKAGDFEVARQAAGKIPAPKERSEAWLSIAQATGEDSDFEAARQAAGEVIVYTDESSEAWLSIAQATGEARDFQAAFEAALEIMDVVPRSKALIAIVKLLAELKKRAGE